MNEYLIEDEYSVYEIDPECQKSRKREKERPMEHCFGKEKIQISEDTMVRPNRRKRRTSTGGCFDCSFLKLLIFYAVLRQYTN